MPISAIDDAATLLRDFHFVDPTWCGTAFVTCWGGELDIYIYLGEDTITPRQLAVVRAVLEHPIDIRPAFEEALFKYYRDSVEGSCCSYGPDGNPIPHSGPPTLTASSQVWTLIDGPDVYIPTYFRAPTAVEFELSFTCSWDPEHGLGALYQDWIPVKFGGWNL